MPIRHPITGCHATLLFGNWWIDADHLEAAVSQALAYDLTELVKINQAAQQALIEEQKKNEGKPPPLPYELIGDKAVITIDGPTTKHSTSFSSVMGENSTLQMAKAVKHALQHDAAKEILIHFDGAPGGNVDGAYDFAQVLMEADKIKPVVGHADDWMTSGAYLFGSCCRRLTANMNCQVGSIGTMSRLIDTSGKYEKEGIKVLPIVAGALKGTGMPGVKLTDAQIKHAQERCNDLNDLFIRHVAETRRLPQKTVRAHEAGVFISKKAREFGLIDDIHSFEHALTLTAPQPRGTRTVVTVPATPTGADPATRSTAMPLTAQQLDTARKLPGGAAITEENADTVLLEVASQLHKRVNDQGTQIQGLEKQIPQQVDPTVAAGHVRVFTKELGFSLKAGQIMPEQEKLIKDAILDGDKVKAGIVQTNGAIMIPSDTFMKVLELNKPTGLTDVKTGSQPAPRNEPGKIEENNDPSKVPADRKATLLGHVGIMPGATATK
jgi:signal peptide peptidase SppA